MKPRRGHVWLVDFEDPLDGEPTWREPAVVVSADALNESPAGVLLVVPITSSRRELPTHVTVEPGPSGLDAVGYAKCEETTSVSEERLVSHLGTVDGAAMIAMTRVLTLLLDL
jgi:mRNA interferase MazF